LRSAPRILGAWHDATSRAGFAVGAALCGYIAASLCFEVVSRYAFDAPTRWANPFANFALAVAIFCALPELTRRGAHICVNILLQRAPARFARFMERSIHALSAAATLCTAYICGLDTWRQFQDGIETMSAVPLPKWWISIFITLGLASAAVHFLRHLVAPGTPVQQAAAL
jgi:TRAP-type C4-dicarboxylate transport system permease small subunit